jgi:hypothetical protein
VTPVASHRRPSWSEHRASSWCGWARPDPTTSVRSGCCARAGCCDEIVEVVVALRCCADQIRMAIRIVGLVISWPKARPAHRLWQPLLALCLLDNAVLRLGRGIRWNLAGELTDASTRLSGLSGPQMVKRRPKSLTPASSQCTVRAKRGCGGSWLPLRRVWRLRSPGAGSQPSGSVVALSTSSSRASKLPAKARSSSRSTTPRRPFTMSSPWRGLIARGDDHRQEFRRKVSQRAAVLAGWDAERLGASFLNAIGEDTAPVAR